MAENNYMIKWQERNRKHGFKRASIVEVYLSPPPLHGKHSTLISLKGRALFLYPTLSR
mgnify:CR=1 FL=1